MDNLDELGDDVLCRYLHQGNRGAFTAIYNRYWQVLFVHAYKMTQSQHDAMDIVQEVFMHIWNNAMRLKIQTQLKAYLYASVRHAILKQIEKSKLNQKFATYVLQVTKENDALPDRALVFKELRQRIDHAVQELPPRMREMFLLSRDEGLSHKEIALILAISENTVKTTIHRALVILKNKLPISLYLMLLEHMDL